MYFGIASIAILFFHSETKLVQHAIGLIYFCTDLRPTKLSAEHLEIMTFSPLIK